MSNETLANQKHLADYLVHRIPRHQRVRHPRLVEFIRAYFEWMEETRNPFWSLQQFLNLHDIDKTIDEFASNMEYEFMFEFPKNLHETVNRKTLLKNIRDFYKSKGTLNSYKFLFRILYNINVEIEYPSEMVFSPSSSNWIQEQVIRCRALSSDQMNVMGKIVRQVNSVTGLTTASARVARIEQFSSISRGISISELYLTDIRGNFEFNRKGHKGNGYRNSSQLDPSGSRPNRVNP
jgi:hypothetical protein